MAPTAGLWQGGDPLLLASTSRVRRALIEAVGVPVETETPGVDERAVQGSGPPAAIAERLARAKALAVSGRRPGRIVVGADQVLDLDGQAFGKPVDAGEARRQLALMSGRSHRLWSATAIARDGRIVDAFVASADLTVRTLGEAEIARYVALAGEAATRSAGGYEVEGLGLHLFERIEGEHTTILGLPMLPLLAALRRMGLLDGAGDSA